MNNTITNNSLSISVGATAVVAILGVGLAVHLDALTRLERTRSQQSNAQSRLQQMEIEQYRLQKQIEAKNQEIAIINDQLKIQSSGKPNQGQYNSFRAAQVETVNTCLVGVLSAIDQNPAEGAGAFVTLNKVADECERSGEIIQQVRAEIIDNSVSDAINVVTK